MSNVGDSDAQLRTTLSRECIVMGRTVAIPDGFKIAKGRVQPGDQYLDRVELKAGRTTWRDAWPEQDSFLKCAGSYAHADVYSLLIRPFSRQEATQQEPQ